MASSRVTRLVAPAVNSALESNDSLRGAADTVFRLARHSYLLDLIQAVRSDAETVEQCAAMSHRHPLGFDKIMLVDANPSFRLRLHAWWPDRSPGIEHIHDHRYDFATAIVRGYYEMQMFRRATTGTQVNEYHQRTSEHDKNWLLDSAGSTHLQMLTTVKVAEGSGYSLAADAMHRYSAAQSALHHSSSGCPQKRRPVFADASLCTAGKRYSNPYTVKRAN